MLQNNRVAPDRILLVVSSFIVNRRIDFSAVGKNFSFLLDDDLHTR